MSCSLWSELKMGCVRKGVVRARGPTPPVTLLARDSAVKGTFLPHASALKGGKGRGQGGQ